MDTSGRWWLVHGIEVDLSAVEGTYTLLLRAAALSHRDAESLEERDIAAYLEWAAGEGETPEGAELIAVEFMATKARQLVERIHARLDRIEARRAA